MTIRRYRQRMRRNGLQVICLLRDCRPEIICQFEGEGVDLGLTFQQPTDSFGAHGHTLSIAE